jgi:alginate O-acetyltransferase complex protein AlgI
MSFGTWLFAAFVALTAAAYWLLPRTARPWLLLVASYVFYAWAFPPYALLLAGITVLAWLAGNRAAAGSRQWLTIGILGILGVLAAFKYIGMAAFTWDALVRATGTGLPLLAIPQVVAPLGISFIAFGIIHYFVAVYRGAKPEGLRDFFAYVAFFPTVTLGPIKLYEPFDRDLSAQSRPSRDDVAYALWRIIGGLAKKLVLAETLVPLVRPLYAPGPHRPVAVLIIAVYAYGLRLYFDFAGYSDIAIGVSRLFGFKIIENFNWPYVRRNLSEFWRTWHASLTRFITQYIYIPLGGSRRGELNRARNVMIAFLASGLWHGAAWHFVAWGAWHGIGLVVLRQWTRATDALKAKHPALQRAAEHPAGHWAAYLGGWFVTINYVMLGWVLFALPLPQAMNVFGEIFGAVFGVGGARL